MNNDLGLILSSSSWGIARCCKPCCNPCSPCGGGGSTSELDITFTNPLSVNVSPIDVNVPTEYTINFVASGSVDLNVSDVKVNVDVEDISGQIQQIVSGSINEIVSGEVNQVVSGMIEETISGTVNQVVDGSVGVIVDGEVDVKLDGEVDTNINGNVNLTGDVALSGNVGVDVKGDINSNVNGDISVTGEIAVGVDGCIGIKECDKEDCVTLIDDELIRIEIVEDDELKVTNKQNIKVNLLVTLLGTKANGNQDFVIMNINLNSNETTTKNIDDSIKDICIIRYVINDFLATFIPK